MQIRSHKSDTVWQMEGNQLHINISGLYSTYLGGWGMDSVAAEQLMK